LVRAVLVTVGVMAAVAGLAMAAGHVQFTRGDLWIVFISMDPNAIEPNPIAIIKPDGTSYMELVREWEINRLSCSSNNLGQLSFGQMDSRRIFLFDAERRRRRQILANELIDLLSWSPDGRFVATRIYPKIDGRIRLTDSEIALFESYTFNQVFQTDNETGNWLPNWSPDGSEIAFVSEEVDLEDRRKPITGLSIAIVNLDTREERTVVALDKDEPFSGLDWSPDGRHLAFAASLGGESGIFTISPNGSNLLQLTRDDTDINPSWSPNSTQIAFSRSTPNGSTRQIFLMADDGSDLRPITHPSIATYHVAPCWLYMPNFPENN
jgi:Tol biopolymer transport system component